MFRRSTGCAMKCKKNLQKKRNGFVIFRMNDQVMMHGLINSRNVFFVLEV